MIKMDLFDLYNTTCADNNTQQSGHFRPNTNYQAWINAISLDLFNQYYAQSGRNQKIKDILDAAFLKSVNVPVVDKPGQDFDFIPFPADYAYYSSVRAFKNESENCGCIASDKDIFDLENNKVRDYEDPDLKEIREKFKGTSVGETAAVKVDNQRWGPAISHKLKKPGWTRVIITEMEGGFKVVPKGLGIILLDYYRYPAQGVFAYTVNTNGTVNYNLGASTQLDWPSQVKPQFLAALKLRFASYTGQGDKYQQAMLEVKETK